MTQNLFIERIATDLDLTTLSNAVKEKTTIEIVKLMQSLVLNKDNWFYFLIQDTNVFPILQYIPKEQINIIRGLIDLKNTPTIVNFHQTVVDILGVNNFTIVKDIGGIIEINVAMGVFTNTNDLTANDTNIVDNISYLEDNVTDNIDVFTLNYTTEYFFLNYIKYFIPAGTQLIVNII